jgi:hypothetical protein
MGPAVSICPTAGRASELRLLREGAGVVRHRQIPTGARRKCPLGRSAFGTS